MSNTLYGAAVVMIKDKEVYLCRRTEKVPSFPKKWQFANGRLRHTEQSLNTAVRVMEEQTMLQIDVKRLHFVQNVTIDETNEFYYVYVLKLLEGEVPMNTCNRWRDDWKLFPLEKAVVLDVVTGIRPILRALNRTCKKVQDKIEEKALIGPPAPVQQQQQQQQLLPEHIRQQMTGGESAMYDNMHAKMTRPLRIPF